MTVRPIVLLVREPEFEERVVSFELAQITIGTSKSNHLVIDDESVSDQLRARIRRQEGELVLINYCAAAPIRVNGQVVNMQGLAYNDVLAIAKVEIIVASDPKLDAREQALVDDIVSSPTDETLRAVYADWLEENGFSDRAEYLRLDAMLYQELSGAWGATKIREGVAAFAGLSRTLPPAWRALMSRRAKKPPTTPSK